MYWSCKWNRCNLYCIENVDGIEEDFSSSINVYPNPAKNQINISIKDGIMESPVCVSIYDILGKVIYNEFSSKNKITINSSDWASGLYTLRLEQNEKSIYKKIIIE